MKKYAKEELKEILRMHELEGGANLSNANLSNANLRGANLSNANLSGADLRGADLIGAIGNMAEIKSIQLDTYKICYTCDRLIIGCQSHSIKEWVDFSDEEISSMDGKKALEFWGKYKKVIFDIIELSPAKLTEEK